jgi:putative endonuclease
MRNFRFTNSVTTKDMVRQNIWHPFASTAPARFIGGHLSRWRKLISRLHKRLQLRAALAPHLKLGRQGEAAAKRFLKKQSFKILYRNFRARSGGEIDLVCRDRKEQVLVFVEVKTRTNELFRTPHEAVTWRKRARVIRAAKEWLRLLDRPEVPFRFDIVEVVIEPKPQVRLIRGAFEMEEGVYSP